MNINAFTLVPDDSSEQLIRRQIEQFYTSDNNQRQNIRLHVALTLCSFNSVGRAKMLQFLNSGGLSLPPILVQVGHLEAIGPDFIGFSLVSSEIIQAHYRLLETLQPFLAENFNPKYLKYNPTPHEIEYLHTYGYHRVKEFYSPHLTVGKYANTEIRNQELKLAPQLFGNIKFDRMQLDECEDGSAIPASIIWETKLTD